MTTASNQSISARNPLVLLVTMLTLLLASNALAQDGPTDRDGSGNVPADIDAGDQPADPGAGSDANEPDVEGDTAAPETDPTEPPENEGTIDGDQLPQGEGADGLQDGGPVAGANGADGVTLNVAEGDTQIVADPTLISPTAESDAQVTAQLRGAFARIDPLVNVEVEVFAGVVTLSGDVASEHAVEVATSIADQLEGVLFVNNGLVAPLRADIEHAEVEILDSTSDRQIAERLRTIYGSAVSMENLNVTVNNGVVHLTGTASSELTVDDATGIASALDGVIFVSADVEFEGIAVSDRVGPLMDRLQSWANWGINSLPVFVLAIVIFIVFWILARLIRSLKAPFRLMSDNPLAQSVFREVAFALVLLIGLLLALELLDATAILGAVLGTAGVLGLALGFALQDTVENYLAGVMLSFRRPFHRLDIVEIASYKGKVMQLMSRETLIMTFDGNHVRIPNAKVYSSVITNFTRNPHRRFDFAVGVGCDEDLVDAQALGLQIIGAIGGVLHDPKPFALIESLGDSSVLIRFYGWIDQRTHDFSKVSSVAIRKVKVSFDQAEIDMPEPIYRVRATTQALEPAKPKPVKPTMASHAEAEVVANDTSVDTVIDDRIRAEGLVVEDTVEDNLPDSAVASPPPAIAEEPKS